MTRRDDAIEAAARALWATGGTDWHEANADERHYHRDCAETALDAALAVLQPTIDNTVEALDALPIGTVLRSGEYLARRMRPGYWAYTDGFMVTTRLTYALAPTVTEWTVIYQPEEDR